MSDLIHKARENRKNALEVTQGLRANVFFDPEAAPDGRRSGSVLRMLADLSAGQGGRNRAILRRAA